MSFVHSTYHPTSPFPMQATQKIEKRKVNNNVPQSERRSVDYHPSIWGDYFLAYDTEINGQEEKEVERLKKEVRKMVLAAHATSAEKLELIDIIQRLGVSYHFEKEIKEYFEHIYNSCDEFDEHDGHNLEAVALQFRLLRQAGYNVSCDVFEKFKDDEGNFKEVLVSNVKGILSLYEAAHLGVCGENILEEALGFTTTRLKSMVPNLSGFLLSQVILALKMPIRRTLPIVAARQFINIYQENPTHNEVLLQFARLNFNMLQKVYYHKEISGLTRWWKDLDVERNFPFARDRLVEAYFWMLGVYFEPPYSCARIFTTKVIYLAPILDDLYDVYGTLDELKMFTDAIQRWDINASNELPPCLKLLYQYILDAYAEMEELLEKENKSYRINYAKTELKKLVRAYFQEFTWFHDGYVPTFEEYLKVALVTSCYMMLSTTSLVAMGEFGTKEDFEWITREPLMVKASCVICRLMDDRVGHKFEQMRGHVSSAIESYMKEFGGSKQEAYVNIEKLVANAWKDMNKESIDPMPVSMPILTCILNYARAINLIYKDEDLYTNSKTKLKDTITKVLVEPS